MKRFFLKVGFLTAMTAALFIAISCQNPAQEPKVTTYKVTLQADANTPAVTYSVEEGSTLASVKDFPTETAMQTAGTLTGFTFKGFFTKEGKEFKTTEPVKSDLVLFVRYEKKETADPVVQGTVTVTKESTETITTDGSSSSEKKETTTDRTTGTKIVKTKTIETKADKSTVETTDVEKRNASDKVESKTTDVVAKNPEGETTETSKEKLEVKEDGTTVRSSEVSKTDAAGNTTETKTSEETKADGTSTKTTETKAADGTTTKETESVAKDGKIQKTTSTTDKEGHTQTTSEVVPPANADVTSLIKYGIEAAKNNDLDSAINLFNAAYKKDPNDNLAKVAGALSDLASISTSSEISNFLKDYVGILNYPATPNALISGEWIRKDKFITTRETELEVIEITEERNYSNYIKASLGTGENSVILNTTTSVRKSGEVYRRTFWNTDCLRKITINGKTYYVTLNDYEAYNLNMQGISVNLLGTNVVGNNYYETRRTASFVPDENGEYLIPAYYFSNKNSEVKTYGCNYSYINYTYPLTYTVPEIAKVNENWFAVTTANSAYLPMLIYANLLQRNEKGLNNAIDALYKATFESTNYKNAITKINSITGSVKVPGDLIKSLCLDEILGGDGDFIIGNTELKLVESLLNIYKALFEYLQSLNLYTDLTFLKSNLLFSNDFETTGPDLLIDTVKNYNATIDPIANNFLGTRADGKLASSKKTLLSVVESLIASYDSMVKDTNYPEAFRDALKECAVYRDGAVQLQSALKGERDKFFIPMKNFTDLETLTSWPTAEAEGVIYLNVKNIFSKDCIALTRLFEMTSTDKTSKAPVFYYEYEDANGNKKEQAITAKDIKSFIEMKKEYDYFDEKVKFLIGLKDGDVTYITNAGINWFKPSLSYQTLIILYNFYYGGLEDELATIF